MPPAVSPFQQHLAPQHQQHLQQHPQQQQHIQPNTFFPSLHLYPLNESFVPKQIALVSQNGRVKIGRQTNAKTVPGERNGYFDSKVLSRQHAEIWEEAGKVRFFLPRRRDGRTSAFPPTPISRLLLFWHWCDLTKFPSFPLTDLHQRCQILKRNFYQRRTALSRGRRV